MRTHFTHFRLNDQEARLLQRGDGADRRTFMQKLFDNGEKRLRNTISDVSNPDAARERAMLSKPAKFAAFLQPNIFTDRVDPAGINKGTVVDRLKSLSPERRLQEFEEFVREEIPDSVRAAYPDLFESPLNDNDIQDYSFNNREGRIGTMLAIMTVLSGEGMPANADPVAEEIAQAALVERNNSAEAPKRLYNLFEEWMDATKPSETEATTPEFVLRRDSGIQGELRAALTNAVEPLAQQELLRRMLDLYRKRTTDVQLEKAQNRVDHLKLTESVQKAQVEKDTSNFIDNFRNADPKLQMVAIGAGLFLGYKMLKADSSLGRIAMAGGLGYFAYDRFVNGNENALNDMAAGLKTFVKFNGNLLKNVAREAGLRLPRNEQDKLELMEDFLLKNRMRMGPAATAMSMLSSVKLKHVADAFIPDLSSGELGGEVRVTNKTVQGRLLLKSLKAQMEAAGMKSSEQKATIDYICEHNVATGQGVAQIFYLLAGSESQNIARATKIEEALTQYGSYNAMPADLKEDYMRLVLEGKQIAATRYGDQRFMDVVSDLNLRKENEKKIKVDTAMDIQNPRIPSRAREFDAMDEVNQAPALTTAPSDVLRDGGSVDQDCTEFIENCQISEVLDPSACDTLKAKFDVIRETSTDLEEALQVIEQLKYAVLIESTRHEVPLSDADIILLTGPNDLTATAILNSVTGFLARFSLSLPGRGFGRIGSLADVRSLLNQPIVGAGPLNTDSAVLTKLQERMNVYDKQMADLRNVDLMAQRMVSKLPSSVIDSFGGDKKKVAEFVRPLLNETNYSVLLGRAEAQLGQRMANALVRATRLNASLDGFGRFAEQGITPIEAGNLSREFDTLFQTIIGDPSKGFAGMWQNVESIKLLREFDDGALAAVDYTKENERLKVRNHVRDLGTLHLIMRLSGKDDPAVTEAIKNRAEAVYLALVESKTRMYDVVKPVTPTMTADQQKEQKLRNLYEVQQIEVIPSLSENSLKEMENILRMLEISAPEKTLTYETFFERNIDMYFPADHKTKKMITSSLSIPTFDDFKNLYNSAVTSVFGGPTAAPSVLPAGFVSVSVLPAGSTVPASVLPAGISVPASVLPGTTPIPVSVLPAGTFGPSVLPAGATVPASSLPAGTMVPASVLPGTTPIPTSVLPATTIVPSASVLPAAPAASVLPASPAASVLPASPTASVLPASPAAAAAGATPGASVLPASPAAPAPTPGAGGMPSVLPASPTGPGTSVLPSGVGSPVGPSVAPTLTGSPFETEATLTTFMADVQKELNLLTPNVVLLRKSTDLSRPGTVDYCFLAENFSNPGNIATSHADQLNKLGTTPKAIADEMQKAYLKWQATISFAARTKARTENDLTRIDPMLTRSLPPAGAPTAPELP